MSKQNRPFKVIDPDTNKEITIWESRSVAVAGFIFCKNNRGKWHVLANQRGDGTPDFQGYWNCPCGYLDYNETAKQAMKREIFEETGLNIPYEFINMHNVNTDIDSNLQNVTIRHYGILNNTIDEWDNFNTDHMEINEVKDIKWIPIDQIYRYTWAFGHERIIMDTYNKFIDIPWWKKILQKMYNKYFN